MNLKEKLKVLSNDLGFELFGIATSANHSIGEAAKHYSEWISSKHHATMEYLVRHEEKKKKPQLILENAKSIIIVGKLYVNLEFEKIANKNPYRISKYTLVEDYHDFFNQKLLVMKNLLIENGFYSENFTDTKPVFERFWAQQAGIGWIGKNTCIINRKFGSFLFLGGLITNAELEADVPYTEHCGKCTKCIDACPTQAIQFRGDGLRTWIESEKCIGYHTIENKGEVPEAIVKKLNGWIAGCDICQDVCPWNDPLVEGHFPGEINPLAKMNLEELNSITEDQFNSLLEKYSMKRMKFKGFVRNILNVNRKN